MSDKPTIDAEREADHSPARDELTSPSYMGTLPAMAMATATAKQTATKKPSGSHRIAYRRVRHNHQ